VTRSVIGRYWLGKLRVPLMGETVGSSLLLQFIVDRRVRQIVDPTDQFRNERLYFFRQIDVLAKPYDLIKKKKTTVDASFQTCYPS